MNESTCARRAFVHHTTLLVLIGAVVGVYGLAQLGNYKFVLGRAIAQAQVQSSAQTAYVKSSNTGSGDAFGRSVAISGNTMVIGAELESSAAKGVDGDQSDNSAQSSGAAYVFERDSNGKWTQQAYLKASNTDTGDVFGRAVAIDGNTIVIGAPLESSAATGINSDQTDNTARGSGAVYVFVRNGTIWTQQAYIKSSNSEMLDNFGEAVAVAGDTVAVGALGEDGGTRGINGDVTDNSRLGSGAVYIFRRNDTVWSQEAYIKASNADVIDEFGGSLSISGDAIVVGASSEDSAATGTNGDAGNNNAADSGAAYVFTRSNIGKWSQTAYLKASNTESMDRFAISVSINGDTIVVGANGEGSSATGVNGDQSNNNALRSGAAYIFARNNNQWVPQAYLKASNTDAEDLFGSRVGVSGDLVTIGASAEDGSSPGIDGSSNNAASSAGAAYLFVRTGGQWNQLRYLKASNPDINDGFGSAVFVDGRTIAVAATSEDSAATGIDGDQSNNGAIFSGAMYLFDAGDTTIYRVFVPVTRVNA